MSSRAQVARCFTVVALAAGVVAGCGDDDSGGVDATPQSNDASADTSVPDAGDGGDGSTLHPQGQIDRAGRPLVSVTMISAGNANAYNTVPTFSAPAAFASFDIDFQTALVKYDQVDGADSWNGGSVPPDAGDPPDGGFLTHPLGELLKLDVLLLDTSKPYSETGFLEIESEIAGGAAHQTSGGRALNADAVDTMASYLVAKARTGISDGVAGPTKPAVAEFPYVVAPE